MLKERVLEITKELVKIYSPTNTAEEQKVEQYLLNLLLRHHTTIALVCYP